MRRYVAGPGVVLGTALCALALLAGCGGSDNGGGATSLNWFVQIQPGGSFQEVAKRCSEESNGRYQIDLELLPTDASQAREQLVRRLGAEDSTIDVVGMDVVWTAEFANAEWLREFPEQEGRQVTKGVFDSVVDTATFENKLYGAPFNSNTQLLWYRTDEIKQAPTTWDEMIDEAEKIGPAGGLIQVQANQYEGFTAWFNALLESAGGHILSGPETVDLPEGPTDEALAVMGRLGNSPVAAPDIDTSTEDTARLGFEAGDSAFMVNYTFAYASAQANAPDVAKNMGFAPYPRVVANKPSRPPLGGFNLGVSAFSDHPGARVRRGGMHQRAGEPADGDGARRPAAQQPDPVHGQGGEEGLSGVRAAGSALDRRRRPAPGDPGLPGRLAGDTALASSSEQHRPG